MMVNAFASTVPKAIATLKPNPAFLPVPKIQDTEHTVEEAIKAGETLGKMVDY